MLFLQSFQNLFFCLNKIWIICTYRQLVSLKVIRLTGFYIHCFPFLISLTPPPSFRPRFSDESLINLYLYSPWNGFKVCWVDLIICAQKSSLAKETFIYSSLRNHTVNWKTVVNMISLPCFHSQVFMAA